ncbi:hypothetical protein ACOME3_005247 [Neoechinorhynchus agilis]
MVMYIRRSLQLTRFVFRKSSYIRPLSYNPQSSDPPLRGEQLKNAIFRHASIQPTALTINQMLQLSSGEDPFKCYKFLRRELPVRISAMIMEIENLPGELTNINSLSFIRDLYQITLSEILSFPADVSSKPKEEAVALIDFFFITIHELLERHNNVVELMATAFIQYKDLHDPHGKHDERAKNFLDRFFMNRIAVRMIMQQHIDAYLNAFNEGMETSSRIEAQRRIDSSFGGVGQRMKRSRTYIDPNCR